MAAAVDHHQFVFVGSTHGGKIPEFYRVARAINGGLAPARRIRVIGGCEPIDWATVRSTADIARYPFKNNWAAHVTTEHFAPAPGRRLLVVYGDGHVHHNGGPMMGTLSANPVQAVRGRNHQLAGSHPDDLPPDPREGSPRDDSPCSHRARSRPVTGLATGYRLPSLKWMSILMY